MTRSPALHLPVSLCREPSPSATQRRADLVASFCDPSKKFRFGEGIKSTTASYLHEKQPTEGR
jgi:hypothetical protein